MAVWKQINKLDADQPVSIHTIDAANILLLDVGEIWAAENFENHAENGHEIATKLDEDTKKGGDQRIVDGLFNDVLFTANEYRCTATPITNKHALIFFLILFYAFFLIVLHAILSFIPILIHTPRLIYPQHELHGQNLQKRTNKL